MTDRKQWFLDRIGKRVFRNKTSCNCETCKDVFKNGVVIRDELHADSLYTIEIDYLIAGHNLFYSDSKETLINATPC